MASARGTSKTTQKRFVVISGLPASGKTRLAHRLAAALHLRVIDKDDILERLFESKGVGDAAWRRTLSRESDLILRTEAAASKGAILTSFWRMPGMPSDSGTPTDWLSSLSDQILNVHCVCEPEIAASRFLQRKRHPGHLDTGLSYLKVLAGFRKLAACPPLEIRRRVCVDTSQDPGLDGLVRDIRGAFRHRRTTRV
jgi:thymidylate kinase